MWSLELGDPETLNHHKVILTNLAGKTVYQQDFLENTSVEKILDVSDMLVGRQLTDGSWVKTISSGSAVGALGKGFQVFTALMHPLKTRLLLKDEFKKPQFAVIDTKGDTTYERTCDTPAQ